MDSIPLILQLIKANAFIYSIALSGNIDSIPILYEKECTVVSEYGVKLDYFALSPSDTFDFALVTRHPEDSFIRIMMFTKSSKYLENVVAYFGNKTVYHKVLHVYKEHGIMPKSPYRYCYPDFKPPVYVAFHELPAGNYGITMEFGPHVCEGRVFSLPGKKEK